MANFTPRCCYRNSTRLLWAGSRWPQVRLAEGCGFGHPYLRFRLHRKQKETNATPLDFAGDDRSSFSLRVTATDVPITLGEADSASASVANAERIICAYTNPSEGGKSYGLKQ